MTGDKLIIDFYGNTLAIETAQIVGIVSNEKTIRLPGRTGFVRGLISLRGEPVAVVDMIRAFGCEDQAFWVNDKNLERIIVVGSTERRLGLFIGAASTHFFWNDPEKKGAAAVEGAEEVPVPPYTAGSVQTEESMAFILDWEKLYNEAAEMLATEKANG